MESLKSAQNLEKPKQLTLSDIALEQCPALQACLLIIHSKRTSEWERSFAQAAYKRQLWRLEHHWLVPPSQRVPSAKEESRLRSILFSRRLDKIDLSDYLPKSESEIEIPWR